MEGGTPSHPGSAICSGCGQAAQGLLGCDGRDWGALVIPDIAGDDARGAAGPCSGYMHRVLKVLHGQGSGVTDCLGAARRYADEAGQLGDKVACAFPSARRGHQVVEIGDGMPRNERGLPGCLDTIEKGRGGFRMGAPIQRQVDEDIRVQQYLQIFPGQGLVSPIVAPGRLQPAAPARGE